MKNMLKFLLNEINYSKKLLQTTFYQYLPSKNKKSVINQLKDAKESTEQLQFNRFPIVLDKPFMKYLIKFLNSPRSKDIPTININNLLFLTGQERSGKTWFLRQVLSKWEKSETKVENFIIHIDLKEIFNFQSFLFLFEKEIITRLAYKASLNEIPYLNNELLLFLLFFRYEKGWIEVNLHQILVNIKEKESIFELDTEFIDKLLLKYYNKSYKETPLLDNIHQIIEKLSNSLSVTTFEACALLIKEILIKREEFDYSLYKKSNSESVDGILLNKFFHEKYRTGLNVLDYFLDVICFISGYHDKHIIENEIGFKLDQANDIKMKYDIICQSVLVIESGHKLYEFCDCEDRGRTYLDHLILRLHNHEGYRNHFPVIIESNDIYFFEIDLYSQLYDENYRFPTLYYEPKQYLNNMSFQLDKIMNNSQKSIVMKLLGNSSIYYYDLFIETLLLYGINSFESLINLSHDIFKKDQSILRYKINKLYLNKRLSDYLDDNTIDYIIADSLIQWNRIISQFPNDPSLQIRNSPEYFDYFKQDITHALLEEGIIKYIRYHSKVSFADYIHTKYIRNEMENSFSLIKSKGMFNTIHFYWYRIFNCFLFSISTLSVGPQPYIFEPVKSGDNYSSKLYLHGLDYKYDVPMELYKGNIIRDISRGYIKIKYVI